MEVPGDEVGSCSSLFDFEDGDRELGIKVWRGELDDEWPLEEGQGWATRLRSTCR